MELSTRLPAVVKIYVKADMKPEDVHRLRVEASLSMRLNGPYVAKVGQGYACWQDGVRSSTDHRNDNFVAFIAPTMADPEIEWNAIAEMRRAWPGRKLLKPSGPQLMHMCGAQFQKQLDALRLVSALPSPLHNRHLTLQRRQKPGTQTTDSVHLQGNI